MTCFPFLRFFSYSVSWTSPMGQSLCSGRGLFLQKIFRTCWVGTKKILVSGPHFYCTDTCDPAAPHFQPAFLTSALSQWHLPSQQLEPLTSLGDWTLDSSFYPLHLNSAPILDSLLLICPSLL